MSMAVMQEFPVGGMFRNLVISEASPYPLLLDVPFGTRFLGIHQGSGGNLVLLMIEPQNPGAETSPYVLWTPGSGKSVPMFSLFMGVFYDMPVFLSPRDAVVGAIHG